MNTAFLKSYECLSKVYGDGAFSTVALNQTLLSAKSSDKALITKIVYGVLEQDIKLTYVLSKFCRKMPKGDVLIFLKIGCYCLFELSVPCYAVVNDVAELTKITGDVRQVGFVNATLKNISATVKSFDDYPSDEIECFAVINSYPLWAFKKLIKDYGIDTAKSIVSCKLPVSTTVRVTNDSFSALDGYVTEKTVFDDCFYVKGKLPPESQNVTYQSVASMAISRVVSATRPQSVLDACSAPGGKAVYVKQMLGNSACVTACELHEHRTELIRSYASRMQTDLTVVCQDSTQFVSQWQNKFDTVFCDVPCSGFGVLDTRPDIKLLRTSEDISSLMKTQYAILENCSNYVKVGGSLVYSTCTVFDNENGQTVRKFLKNHPEYTYGKIVLPEFPNADGKGYYQFLPHVDGIQGFFVAVLTKTE